MLYFSVQVVVAGPSKNYHEETVVADAHSAPLHPSNVQVLYALELSEVHQQLSNV